MISDKLVSKTFKYYDKFENDKQVVKPSLPILYFGDLNRYLQSKIKVVTVGKNPSDNEFRLTKQDPFSFVRFPDWNDDRANLMKSLNSYFANKPLKNWFSCFKPILKGAKTSYYSNEYKGNIALHTDICSPLATNPTWSKLPVEKRKLFYQEGVVIWKELIEELQPDIMFVSIPRRLFKSIFTSEGKQLTVFFKKKNGVDRKKPYTVEKFEYLLKSNKRVNVIFGQAANKPFGSISTDQKNKIGNLSLQQYELQS